MALAPGGVTGAVGRYWSGQEPASNGNAARLISFLPETAPGLARSPIVAYNLPHSLGLWLWEQSGPAASRPTPRSACSRKNGDPKPFFGDRLR